MTLFLSHRGESDDAPENTAAAFRLAMERDSDGIELDIRLTADQRVVCVHDETLQRVAGAPLPVESSTLEELRRHWPVPLLDEALAALLPGKMMQIELKGTAETVPRLKTILDGWGGDRRQLVLSSFEPETILRASEVFSDLPRVLLIDLERRFGRFPEAAETAVLMRGCGCTGVSFKATGAVTPEFVKSLQESGMRVVAWGVSSDELGLRMAAAGVDAMTCNHAVALREKWRSLTGARSG